MTLKPAVESMLRSMLAVREGGAVFETWRRPPMESVLSLTVFNITNPEEFLAGKSRRSSAAVTRAGPRLIVNL